MNWLTTAYDWRERLLAFIAADGWPDNQVSHEIGRFKAAMSPRRTYQLKLAY